MHQPSGFQSLLDSGSQLAQVERFGKIVEGALLHRINRELRADIPIDAFVHEARWNDMLSRIEMHLRAVRDVQFTVEGQGFAFAAGATIHTENSHKYGPRGGRLLLLAGGWTPSREWVAPGGDFALILAEAQRDRFAP